MNNILKILYSIAAILFFLWLIAFFNKLSQVTIIAILFILVGSAAFLIDTIDEYGSITDRPVGKFLFWCATPIISVTALLKTHNYLGEILNYNPTVASATFATLFIFQIVSVMGFVYAFFISIFAWLPIKTTRSGVLKGARYFGAICPFFAYLALIVFESSHLKSYTTYFLETYDFVKTTNCTEGNSTQVLFIGDGAGLAPKIVGNVKSYKVVKCF